MEAVSAFMKTRGAGEVCQGEALRRYTAVFLLFPVSSIFLPISFLFGFSFSGVLTLRIPLLEFLRFHAYLSPKVRTPSYSSLSAKV